MVVAAAGDELPKSLDKALQVQSEPDEDLFFGHTTVRDPDASNPDEVVTFGASMAIVSQHLVLWTQCVRCNRRMSGRIAHLLCQLTPVTALPSVAVPFGDAIVPFPGSD